MSENKGLRLINPKPALVFITLFVALQFIILNVPRLGVGIGYSPSLIDQNVGMIAVVEIVLIGILGTFCISVFSMLNWHDYKEDMFARMDYLNKQHGLIRKFFRVGVFASLSFIFVFFMFVDYIGARIALPMGNQFTAFFTCFMFLISQFYIYLFTYLLLYCIICLKIFNGGQKSNLS